MLKLCLRAMIGVAILSASALAGPLVLTGGVMNPVPTCTVGAMCQEQSGAPYWFNRSQDDGVLPIIVGQPRNLASIVNGTSPYTAPTFTNASWYGQLDQVSAVSDLFFGGIGGYDVTLLIAETGNDLVFGWYGFDGSGAIVEGGVLLGKVGSDPLAQPQSAQFTSTTGNFGFFVKYGRPADCVANDWRAVCEGTILDIAGGKGVPLDIYYTQIFRNSAAGQPSTGAPDSAVYEADYQAARQHFVAIPTAQGLLIGVEDSWSTDSRINTLNTAFAGNVFENSGDYNDMVLLVTAVPEPSTIVLCLLGFGGLMMYGRKRCA